MHFFSSFLPRSFNRTHTGAGWDEVLDLVTNLKSSISTYDISNSDKKRISKSLAEIQSEIEFPSEDDSEDPPHQAPNKNMIQKSLEEATENLKSVTNTAKEISRFGAAIKKICVALKLNESWYDSIFG
jgi:hypothetical protein